jgi:hypothetical protein
VENTVIDIATLKVSWVPLSGEKECLIEVQQQFVSILLFLTPSSPMVMTSSLSVNTDFLTYQLSEHRELNLIGSSKWYQAI